MSSKNLFSPFTFPSEAVSVHLNGLVSFSNRRPYEKFADDKTVCIEDEIPFDIPDSWAWARLGRVSDYGKCVSVDTYQLPSDTWSLDLEEIEKGTGRLIERKTVGEKVSTSAKHVFKKGMVLYSKLRTYLNKVLVADLDGVCTSEIIPISLEGDILPEYLRHVLMSSYFLAYTASKDYGVKMPRVGTEDARKALIPIPPLAEQKRIVVKIEELFAEVDKIATAKDSIARTVERINKKVLDLAIRGQLVPQDPNDEPAEELLKRIAEARQQSAKTRKSKHEESVIFRSADRSAYETRNGKTVCINDEIPFDIPDSWAWARLESIARFLSGNTPSKDLFTKNGLPYFKVAEMNLPGNEKYLSYTKLHLSPSAEVKTFPPLTIVFPKNGGAMLTNKKRILAQESVCDLNTGGLFPYVAEVCEYLFAWFASIDLAKYVKGGVIPTTDADKLRNTLIPLPPLAEQKRIVAKIEGVRKLMQSFTI